MTTNPDSLRLQQDLLPRNQLGPYLRGGTLGSTPVMQEILQAFCNLVAAQLTGAGPDELGTPVLLGADGNRALYVRLQPSTSAPTTGQVSATNTATLVVAADKTRNAVVLTNADSTNPVWIGPSGVTDMTGFQLNAGLSISLSTTAAIYATGGSNTVTVGYLTVPA